MFPRKAAGSVSRSLLYRKIKRGFEIMAKNRKKKGPAPRKKTPISTDKMPKKQQTTVDEKETGKKLKTGIITAIVIVVIIAVLLIFALVLSNKGVSQSTENSNTQSSLASGETVIDETKTYYADIDIKDYGKITVELDYESAPKTVENFVKLANSKFYDGLTFHRIIEGFMMQGGQAKEGMEEPETIVGEFSANGFNNTISHTRGTISMARTGADMNSASSQFFIVHEDSLFLDGQYAAFGHVTEGIDVVDKVCTDAKPTDDNGTIPEDEQPIINSITVRTVDK